jgi:beta-glucosidase-like glycosyl hydrolase
MHRKRPFVKLHLSSLFSSQTFVWLWLLAGYVLGTEQRALSNIGASRFHQDHKNPVCLTAFGPNINIVRDPRFGRNSELASEDPFLSGTYAAQMVSGMQQRDEKGYKKTTAYLKHYTAYSTEANRGHDTRHAQHS